MTFFKNSNTITVLIGLLLGVGFVVPQLWLLALLGVGWLVSLFFAGSLSYKKIYFIWFVKTLLVTCWVWAVYPMDWLGFDLGWVELPVIAFYWLSVTAGLATGGLVFYALLSNLSRFTKKRGLILMFVPGIWLLSDMFGSFVFSVLLYGPGGSIGTTFSMGYVGYLLTGHPGLMQLASLGGVYVLSLCFVALAMLLFFWFERRRFVLILLTVVSLVLTSFWQPTVESDGGLVHKVAVVDTQLPVELSHERKQTIHLEVFAATKNISPDYIIFPEDSRVFDQSVGSEALLTYLGFAYSDWASVIVDSGRVERDTGPVLQAAVYDGKNKKVYQSHKSYLVPQGEFLPYLYSFLFSLVGEAESSRVLQERLAYRVGPDTSQSHFSSKIPGILFCFEVVDPRGVKKIVDERPADVPFVAHIVSHGWIHHSHIFLHQLQSMLQVQAVWSDTYIVKSGNDVKGYTVTPKGEIRKHRSVSSGEDWEVSVIEIPQ